MHKVGIIGTGDISAAYLRAARDLKLFEVAAITDLDTLRASARGEEFGVAVLDLPDLLNRSDLSAIVNLTPPAAHAGVSLDILRAGHHAYSEKPLAVTLEDARTLLAEAQLRGLRLGCAPDTFLGAGLQTVREAIDSGLIGRPVAATAFFMGSGPEAWHPNPAFFYQPGAGPLFDMGPYYLTALVNLLGPVVRVSGSAVRAFSERVAGHESRLGECIAVDTPTHVTAQLEFGAGMVGTFIASFDVPGSELPRIEIYGTSATISVPDPNTFGGPVRIRRLGSRTWEELPITRPYAENSRGIGLADLLSAADRGAPHRASGELAGHVLEIMHRTLESAEVGRPLAVESRPERPAALPPTPEWLEAGQLEGARA
ncbi:Gfo/Idh/MocA family oxidoreductase (plasmid) [Deinococcus radiomollis]|uniref:Gfo/Idh/MocA family protein n=1 Tax=Deinococcus radiomollis TaxID=468916 RepID=UPI0038926E85